MKQKRYTRHRSLAMTPDQNDALDFWAAQTGMAVSEFVRAAIEEKIRRCKK